MDKRTSTSVAHSDFSPFRPHFQLKYGMNYCGFVMIHCYGDNVKGLGMTDCILSIYLDKCC